MTRVPPAPFKSRGVVQGVGFRPFVYRLARANDAGGLGAERRKRAWRFSSKARTRI